MSRPGPACPNKICRGTLDGQGRCSHCRGLFEITGAEPVVPAAPTGREACLVIIYGDDMGKVFALHHPAVVVGRASKCEIRIPQESISRLHAKIVRADRSFLIRDLASVNGTYVNDEPIDERALHDGDLVKIGRTIFKFLAAGSLERAYHEEMYRRATAERPFRPSRPVSDLSATAIVQQRAIPRGGGAGKKGSR